MSSRDTELFGANERDTLQFSQLEQYITLVRSAERVNSNIVYQFGSRATASGLCEPDQLGQGRFAKVYRVWQRSDGQGIREVAIKILHNTATYAHQNLFDQEIGLLKDLNAKSKSNVLNLLDIVQLGPMIMCGCGRVYHPVCPECGQHLLKRKDIDGEYPALACPQSECGYEVSAKDIETQRQKLTSAPAKSCCSGSRNAREGTIINFVDRRAMVMELQDARLEEFLEKRSSFFSERCQGYATLTNSNSSANLFVRHRQAQDRARLGRAVALDKMVLMVQLAEAVAWLHDDMELIHKDLTPDNIMVNFGSVQQHQIRRRRTIGLQSQLLDLVSYPSFNLRVIDFGLADRKKLTRKWYDERDINNTGYDKFPYFSPEARQRMQRVNEKVMVDGELKRIKFPEDIYKSPTSVHEGDILTFPWDHGHAHELTITRIESGPEPGTAYAYFEGEPPSPGQRKEMHLVLPLGEAHDIYSVGALFYYIFTGNHLGVDHLAGFVNAVQRNPCELIADALQRRHGDSYLTLRKDLKIPDVYWQDRLMELIMRAMVRGYRDSFNRNRSERGADAAHKLLEQTRALHNGFREQIFSETKVREVKQRAGGVAAASAAVLLTLTAGYEYLNSNNFAKAPSSFQSEKSASAKGATPITLAMAPTTSSAPSAVSDQTSLRSEANAPRNTKGTSAPPGASTSAPKATKPDSVRPSHSMHK